MELFIFGRFHACAGQDAAVAAAIREVVGPTRSEPGCLAVAAYRSDRDPCLFYIHSRRIDDAAFEAHAGLPHTMRFVALVRTLIDHELDVTRAYPIASEPAILLAQEKPSADGIIGRNVRCGRS